jgi:hypothetical protein
MIYDPRVINVGKGLQVSRIKFSSIPKKKFDDWRSVIPISYEFIRRVDFQAC